MYYCVGRTEVGLFKVRYEGEKNKIRGGWIVVSFSFLLKTKVIVQKQIEFNFWSEVQNLNAADKYRERERHKTII